jgi:hypothetical protein
MRWLWRGDRRLRDAPEHGTLEIVELPQASERANGEGPQPRRLKCQPIPNLPARARSQRPGSCVTESGSRPPSVKRPPPSQPLPWIEALGTHHEPVRLVFLDVREGHLLAELAHLRGEPRRAQDLGQT